MSEKQEVRTTWGLPKSLIKQLKQYALDHETTMTSPKAAEIGFSLVSLRTLKQALFA